MDMAHGYLGDDYGSHGDIDPDRNDERKRGMMFGDERDRRWSRDRDWSDEDRRSNRGWQGSTDTQDHNFGDEAGQRRRYSANADDHYRSWRDRHMSELDRDYQDYCREREQQFHREFDEWRNQKHGNPQPLRTGMTQTGMSHDPSGELQLTTEARADQSGTDPMGEATLGTNSSAEGRSSRGRR
jgi:hypothetical protein